MDRRIDFHGLFRCEARRNLAPGSGYVGVRCKACQKHFALMDDLGAGAVEFGGDGRFATECPVCTAAGEYTTAELETFQAAQGGAFSTT